MQGKNRYIINIGLADVENEGVVARQDVRERRREAGLVLSGYVDLDTAPSARCRAESASPLPEKIPA